MFMYYVILETDTWRYLDIRGDRERNWDSIFGLPASMSSAQSSRGSSAGEGGRRVQGGNNNMKNIIINILVEHTNFHFGFVTKNCNVMNR